MRAIAAMIRKDLVLLGRDRTGLFFTLLFPLIMATFFGSVFSGNGDGASAFDVAVVDEDGTSESQAFAKTLAQAAELDVQMASKEEALGMVRNGEKMAYLIMPSGFGAARSRLFWGAPPTVHVGVDPSRTAEAAMLEGIIMSYLVRGFETLISDRAASRQVVKKASDGLALMKESPDKAQLADFLGKLDGFLDVFPAGESAGGATWSPGAIDVVPVVREGHRPPNYFAISFPQGIVWGLMMCAMTFALGLVTERSHGTLMRLRIAPLRLSSILLGKAGACLVVVLVLQVGLLVIGSIGFGVELGSPVVVVMALASSAVCFVGIMLLFSVLGRTEKAASGYATAIMLVLMMIGGGMIPLFVMPAWMQTMSHASPVKWAVLALEGATWRGFGPTQIALPCAILLTVGLGCFAIGTQLFRDR